MRDLAQSQRGSGRVGFIVALAICLSAAFAGTKIIPVRVAAYEFRDTIRQEARMGAVRNSDSAVAKRIMEKAEELELPLSKKNLSVKRTKSKLIVKASYEVPIDLMVTTYTFRFDAEERAPLF